MANTRNYIGSTFSPNQIVYGKGYNGVEIQRGRISNKKENLQKALEMIRAQYPSMQFNDGWSIQQFINKELDKLTQTYGPNYDYGHIQEDGIVGNQTLEALNYIINNSKTNNEMANPNNSEITYGRDAYGYIGTDESGNVTTRSLDLNPTPEPVQKQQVGRYGPLSKDDYYGRFTNFASMRDYVMRKPDSNFARLATDYLKTKHNLTWDSSPVEIEKALNVNGNYHRGRGGDLYDIGQVLNAFAGTQDKINGYEPEYKNIMKTKKYQAGGAAPQGDPQEQIIQLVQAAMQGDQQATAQIQQIMQAAQQGDPQAGQIAEMIMQVMNQMQGGAPQAARNGAKLNYIKRLKGECPEGYEMAYFKAGGKVCKKCQKVMKNCGGGKSKKACGGLKFHRAGGVMEDILTEIFAKGGAMNRNKHTAFGEERGANVVSTNHAGRWGGRRAFNANGTHQLNKHDKPNKFTAFGDEGKKKPTNVGLVGHKATGKTGRMQNRQKAGTTYKGTAFGGEKQKRFHKGAKASSIGRIGSINGYPKGHGGKSGIGKI